LPQQDLGGPAPETGLIQAPREPWVTRRDVRLAVVTILVLILVGLVLGGLWELISPARPRGYVISAGIIPDETESFVASDGRFAIITALAGLAAALIVWARPATRGPVAIVGLAVGSLLGAAATDLAGRLLGGGTTSGKVNTSIAALPLQVHATVLLVLQALIAVLGYGLLTLFSSQDDLGRPLPAGPVSVGSGDDL